MAVITVSRQFGSGGNEIAARLCQMLGYQSFDKSLIAQAAQEAGLTAKEVTEFSEDNYKIRGFFDRLFDRPRTLAEALISGEELSQVRYDTDELRLNEDDALALVQKAIEAACQQGNTVIVGRGGQVILKDHPDVLHVRIEAPFEDRIQRVKAQILSEQKEYGLVDARRAAWDIIEAKDAASADYLKCFYQVDWSDRSLYHLVINMGKVSSDLAVHTIAEMALHLSSSREGGL